ncbi:hypoxanthine phosphoribosyltransferase [bacterium]|nr:hypoxanthine phosphoribosyltransferase [bacterium]
MKIDKACKEIIISEEKIIETCKMLGAEISRDYEGKEVTMVGLLNGCNPFFSDLIKYVDLQIVVDYIKCSSYHGKTKSSNDVKILKDLDQSIVGKHVIIVDDIIDTGKTMKKIMEIFKVKGALSVEACVLLYKETEDKNKYNAKYVGLSIPNAFVIGYGLDFQEHYRNLPYIGIISDDLIKEEN